VESHYKALSSQGRKMQSLLQWQTNNHRKSSVKDLAANEDEHESSGPVFAGQGEIEGLHALAERALVINAPVPPPSRGQKRALGNDDEAPAIQRPPKRPARSRPITKQRERTTAATTTISTTTIATNISSSSSSIDIDRAMDGLCIRFQEWNLNLATTTTLDTTTASTDTATDTTTTSTATTSAITTSEANITSANIISTAASATTVKDNIKNIKARTPQTVKRMPLTTKDVNNNISTSNSNITTFNPTKSHGVKRKKQGTVEQKENEAQDRTWRRIKRISPILMANDIDEHMFFGSHAI
ncbi:hypothetical protein BG004_002812, partial [Podila humilis]